MLERQFKFRSTDPELTKLHCLEWRPDGEIKAVIQVAHGLTEHFGRYKEFAKFMTDNGIAIIGYDLIGHGMSISDKKAPMYLGKPGSFKYLVKDFVNFYEMVDNFFPNIPHIVMGFSLGTFIIRNFLIDYPKEFKPDVAILIGTGRISSFDAKLAKWLVTKIGNETGFDQPSKKINDFAFGMYNKYFTPNLTDFDWLCSDNGSLVKYINDPLVRKQITPGLFYELLCAMEYTCRKSNISKMDLSIPTLLMSGEKYPVGNFGKGVKKVVKDFGSPNASLLLYPGVRHDILHETIKQQVFEDLLCWITTNVL